MDGSDEAKISPTQQTIVEDKRSDCQSLGQVISCRLHKNRYTEIKMPVVLAQNDLVFMPFEHTKNTYSVVLCGFQIDRSF
ncbi:hypothetical protein ATN79_48080 [Paraburkholderia caribensis]|nr:hypothetical protein ATN79_48080 [Paraburkholderia caribensis]